MNHYAVENLFGIEGLNIAWYGIIITFGMILGFMLALRRCKKNGVESDHLFKVSVFWYATSYAETAAATYTVTKEIVDPKPEYNVGDTINYTIKVTNTGNLTLNNLVVTDQMQGAAVNAVISDQAGVTVDGNKATIATVLIFPRFVIPTPIHTRIKIPIIKHQIHAPVCIIPSAASAPS